MKKTLIGILLIVSLVVGLLPVAALADNTPDDSSTFKAWTQVPWMVPLGT